jgi:hypothetical protein
MPKQHPAMNPIKPPRFSFIADAVRALPASNIPAIRLTIHFFMTSPP